VRKESGWVRGGFPNSTPGYGPYSKQGGILKLRQFWIRKFRMVVKHARKIHAPKQLLLRLSEHHRASLEG